MVQMPITSERARGLMLSRHSHSSELFRRTTSRVTSLFLIFGFLIPIPHANAATIGSGNCIQTVNSVESVTVVESGGFCYVAFRAGSRVWNTPVNVSTIDFLVVGGGGSGGSRHAGGGGAGGLLRGTSISISGVTALSVSVGAGASSPSRVGGTNYIVGTKGADSSLSKNSGSGVFDTRNAIGGGGGGAGGVVAESGGSGGGSQSNTVTTFVSGQGNAGGTGGGNWHAGGGGGAGGVGLNFTSTSGGAGGPGAIWISAFTTTIATSLGLVQTNQVDGTQVYFSGGGGGSSTSTTPGAGGLGGGGAAVLGNNTGVSGGVNSGGGGGGSGCCDGGAPGAGGSGVVLIRYVPDTTAPSFTNGTSFSFAENTTSSTNAATITVSESSTVTLNASGDHLLFTVVTSDSTTVRIRFASSPNFESPSDSGANNVYDLSVRATDTAGNVANQSITISVTNVNEAPTISTASSAATHTISQAENIASVVTYAGADVDAGTTLTWSISGTDAADFSINSSSGALAFATNPDFEAPADADTSNAYVVVVTLSDGSLTDTQTVTITITNANELASINAPTVSGTINKGVNTTITVTINVAGKVRFFVGNKRISTCKERTTSGTYPNNSATCTWKPAVTGRQFLTATLTPTDNTFSASTSARTEVFVARRGTTR